MKTYTITLSEVEYNNLKKLLDYPNDVQIVEELQMGDGEYALLYHAVTEDAEEREE